MVLSHLLCEAKINHTLLHCNFQLRGKEADQDEEFVINYAKQRQLIIYTKKFNTAEFARIENLSIQEAARNLRYDWFNSYTSKSNQYLLTAHHLDDSIETFFVNLLRGTSLKGLTGIPAKRDRVLRPLLNFSKNELTEYAVLNNITFREDSSNLENKYQRNKLRNLIIPQLAESTNSFQEKMKTTLQSLQEVNSYLLRQAAAFRENHFSDNGTHVSIAIKLLLEQENVFIQHVFKPFGITRKNRNDFIKILTRETGKYFASQTHSFIKNREEIQIIKLKAKKENRIDCLEIKQLPASITLLNQKIEFERSANKLPLKTSNIHQLDFNKIKFPLSVRKWKQGDKIIPLGMSGHKKISDILIDNKLNKLEKQSVLVIVDVTGTIISVHGLLINDKLKITPTTEEILVVKSMNKT